MVCSFINVVMYISAYTYVMVCQVAAAAAQKEREVSMREAVAKVCLGIWRGNRGQGCVLVVPGSGYRLQGLGFRSPPLQGRRRPV